MSETLALINLYEEQSFIRSASPGNVLAEQVVSGLLLELFSWPVRTTASRSCRSLKNAEFPARFTRAGVRFVRKFDEGDASG